MQNQIKNIGVMTSGGDAPGMNAAIRSVVRSGLNSGYGMIGIQSGYQGILDKKFIKMGLRSVANIIQRGGTMLKTARCLDFLDPNVRTLAVQNLRDKGIDALVCIGGDGSFRGLHALFIEHNFPVIGIPGTIDNDIFGTEYSIGFDTAVNTAVEAIDRIRDTATSHDRLFIVEVMGRDSGFIAMDTGIAGGAQEVFVPEHTLSVDKVIERIQASIQKGKLSSILVTAEGQKPGRAYDLAEQIRKKSNIDAKVCILGHIQRGGVPSARDRILASAFGAAAISAFDQGMSGYMVALQNSHIGYMPLADVINQKKNLEEDRFKLTQILSM